MSNTVIVGGGIAGLTAAYYLHKAGRNYQIIEASDRVGGRIKTDVEGGYRYDRGFQVFLTAYPEAKKFLDYDRLDLKSFSPGAVLLRSGGRLGYIGDPLREISSLIPTLTTSAASISDKFKILATKSSVTEQSIDDIFDNKEVSTLQTLQQEYGFSDRIIGEFLKPFYAGIFLESELSTSRRMFDFVFKMFSEGEASIPALGMEEIPKQIAAQLDSTKILCNTRVVDIKNSNAITSTGQLIEADHIIIATEATSLCREYADVNTDYRSTTNLYFSAADMPYHQNAIALNGDPNKLVNNMVCLSKNAKEYALLGHLISVSLRDDVDHKMPALAEKVKMELTAWIPSAKSWEHRKTYKIKYALPNQTQISNDNIISVNDHITIIGDHTMNGSINAAMKSGRLGAEKLISM
jgi:protoporphyrinogen oxidase